MSDIVIIFGAGASYDVLQKGIHNCNEEFRPPLTNELFDKKFDELMSDFGNVGGLKCEIRGYVANKKGSLEDFLKTKRDRFPGSELIEKQLAELRFYLKRLFIDVGNKFIPPNNTKRHHNNYVSLLDHIKNLMMEAPTLITFNYDLFLDRAVEQVFDKKLLNIESYTNNLSSAKLFKIHGSVDWVYFIENDFSRKIESFDVASRWIANRERSKRGLEKGGLFKDENIQKISESRLQDYQTRSDSSVIAPALAIPLPSEKNFIIESHEILIARELELASKVVVIGWSAGDEHFRTFMKKHIPDDKVDLFIIDAPNQSGTVIKNLTMEDAPRWKNVVGHESGFSGLISDPNLMKEVFG